MGFRPHSDFRGRQVIADWYWRDQLCNIEGIDRQCTALASVPLRGLPGDPEGDIDILLVPPGRPDRATAIQVKRVRVGPKALQTGAPNGLQGIDEGARQANLCATIRFFQVYLWPFVVVDSRERNPGGFGYDGLTTELDSLIRDAITTTARSRLRPGVGLVRFKFVQSKDRPALNAGSGGISLGSLADEAEQPEAVTAWVAATLAAAGA